MLGHYPYSKGTVCLDFVLVWRWSGSDSMTYVGQRGAKISLTGLVSAKVVHAIKLIGFLYEHSRC